MKMKTFMLSLVLVVIASLLTAALVVAGTRYFKSSSDTEEKPAFSLFKKKEKEVQVSYVEQKNLLITLKGNASKERYLMLDLAFVTNNDDEAMRTEHSMPRIKFVVVEMFSGMEYSAARAMSVEEMRMQMMTRFEGAFGPKLPFQDVMIAKMVFQ